MKKIKVRYKKMNGINLIKFLAVLVGELLFNSK